MSTLQFQGQQLFNNVYRQFSDYQVAQGMSDLFQGLFHLRRNAVAEEWREFARHAWLDHPLRGLAHQDPLTRRAFEKPRGYAGDAELLDLAYGLRELPQTSGLGEVLYGHMFQIPATQAVRARRDHLAARLDAVAGRVKQPRILAVACGHLREAQKSVAVAQGRIGEFIGLDQDQASIELLAREQSASGIKAVNGSVKSILRGQTVFEDLDFVYSTGLYDYLPQPVATKLTAKLFSMLKPGGELLLANFLPNVPDVGYMETFMGWPLIYRTADELADVAQAIAPEQIAARRTYCDTHRNIVYLELEKR